MLVYKYKCEAMSSGIGFPGSLIALRKEKKVKMRNHFYSPLKLFTTKNYI